ncbi:glycosyl transferase family 2 [Vibrio cholerae]|nr:rhamnosyltransferase [Vibrio cholerae]GHX71533.1 glycosyl transferase family 2 [Vibrio cholerae]
MNLYISVVSHRHGNLIKQIDALSDLAKNFNVVVKNNCEDIALVNYCNQNHIKLIDSDYGLGFGANNNKVFQYCISDGIKDNDYFLVLNPDVLIKPQALTELMGIVVRNSIKLCTINLYLDENHSEYDNSIREFPSLKNFIASFIGLGNDTIINKSIINEITSVDWAAGSFLMFQVSEYRKLQGFDESYFMYCEDIDICFRARKEGVFLKYIPNVKGVHFARHSNRKLFSKHFLWHLIGAIKFLYRKSKIN